MTVAEDIPISHPPLVIAEAGVNHNGDVSRALDLVDVAADAGADMVKFQAFTAVDLVAETTPTAAYQERQTKLQDQSAMLRDLELGQTDLARVADRCTAKGIAFLCTPFTLDWLPFLLDCGMPAVKVASGELTNGPALRRFAETGQPIYLSTGMADMAEVAAAVETLQGSGATEITALQCTSLYPAPPETLNLRAMVTMRDQLGLPVGFSDHSLGDQACIAATALGATVLEKHFTLDRSLPGPDHAASLEPGELAIMIGRVRETAKALGTGVKQPAAAEMDTARVARRSWHVVRDLPAGHILEAGDVRLIRPLGGLAGTEDPVGRKLLEPVVSGGLLLANAVAD